MKYSIVVIVLSLWGSICCAQNRLPMQQKVTSSNGDVVQMGEIIKGDLPLIITFWATWCRPCQNELEALKDMQEEWQGKVRIIAISMDDSRASAKVKALVSGKKWPFEIYQDINQEFFQTLNFSSIPFAVVVSSSGAILYQHTGYSPGGEVALIDAALKSKGK